MRKIVGFLLITGWLAACNSPSGSTNKTESKTTMEKSTGKEWIKTTNIYEVNVRQYTQEGTFNAFLKELPRLKEMGVETLWFMPITPIAQKNMKGPMGSP